MRWVRRRTHDEAKQWLEVVRQSYGPISNPSLNFLDATVAFDSGNRDEAFMLFDNLFREFGARSFEGAIRNTWIFIDRHQMTPTTMRVHGLNYGACLSGPNTAVAIVVAVGDASRVACRT